MTTPSSTTTASRREISRYGRMPLNGPAMTAADLRPEIERFNGFHDAFIRKLEAISTDSFNDADGMSQTYSGNVSLCLDIAHVNYRPRSPRAAGIIRARFDDVDFLDLHLGSLPPKFHSWSIVDVTVAEVNTSPGLTISLWTEVETPGKGWQREALAVIHCSAASFEEVENP